MALGRDAYNQGQNAQFDMSVETDSVSPPCIAKGPGAVAYGLCAADSNAMMSSNPHSGVKEMDRTNTLDGNGGNPSCNKGGTAIVQPVAFRKQAHPMDASQGQGYEQTDVNDTLNVFDNSEARTPTAIVEPNYIVRRLTPRECERLQGFPDDWTDIGEWTDDSGKKHKTTDSSRYKALGNSIALPQWRWLLKRISAQYDCVPTMASLFDGIGGFPYLWEQINGQGTCIWASEIEPFCIAVTEKRINKKE